MALRVIQGACRTRAYIGREGVKPATWPLGCVTASRVTEVGVGRTGYIPWETRVLEQGGRQSCSSWSQDQVFGVETCLPRPHPCSGLAPQAPSLCSPTSPPLFCGGGGIIIVFSLYVGSGLLLNLKLLGSDLFQCYFSATLEIGRGGMPGRLRLQ